MTEEESEYETTSDEEEVEETASESEEEQEEEQEKTSTIQLHKPEAPKEVEHPAVYPDKSKNEYQNLKTRDQKSVSETVTEHQASTHGQKKMTTARKLNLKSMMLNKAREDLKAEAEHKAEEKKRILNSRIQPIGNLSEMDETELKDLCRNLQAKIETVDEQRYDVDAKVKKNDQEIEDLNQRIFDLRGKFKRPPLRRVRISADEMLRALLGAKHKVSMDLRSNLKSVKKDEPKKEETKDWRGTVEAKQNMSGKKAMFEQASQQEAQEAAQEEEEE